MGQGLPFTPMCPAIMATPTMPGHHQQPRPLARTRRP